MKKLEVKDCLPSKPKFSLRKFPGHEFTVRPPNMTDHVWFCDNYETLLGAQKIIASRNWGEICRIVYYLMGSEDRAKFPARTDENFVNENGVKEARTHLGWQLLLASLDGIEEASGVLAALARAIMTSNPIIEKAVNDEIKKKTAEINAMIGAKSSTSSSPNTAGRNKK